MVIHLVVILGSHITIIILCLKDDHHLLTTRELKKADMVVHWVVWKLHSLAHNRYVAPVKQNILNMHTKKIARNGLLASTTIIRSFLPKICMLLCATRFAWLRGFHFEF